MYGFLIISHSLDLALGTKELAENLADKSAEIKITALGGTGKGELGIDVPTIKEALLNLMDLEGILIFADLGSSILATDMVLEDLAAEGYDVKHFQIVNAPLVEGVVLGCNQAGNYKNAEELKNWLENYYLPKYNQQFPPLKTS